MTDRRQMENEIKQELASQGYSVSFLDEWPARATYYKPSGEAMHNLPADPYSMKRYLDRGFTLYPPSRVKEGLTQDKIKKGVSNGVS